MCAWDEQRTRTETLGVMAVRMTKLPGDAPLPPNDVEAFDARVAELVADFVEPARSDEYHEAGDGGSPLSIAMSWLRPRLGAGDRCT
jgi:hypothetical protein